MVRSNCDGIDVNLAVHGNYCSKEAETIDCFIYCGAFVVSNYDRRDVVDGKSLVNKQSYNSATASGKRNVIIKMCSCSVV